VSVTDNIRSFSDKMLQWKAPGETVTTVILHGGVLYYNLSYGGYTPKSQLAAITPLFFIRDNDMATRKITIDIRFYAYQRYSQSSPVTSRC
jgi:hypothetical protein